MDPSVQILSDITVYMKYARYLPEKKRRETWDELVTRNKEMHIKKFPELVEEIENAYKLVYEKKVLPSMRSMQFAGKPIEINPTRIYNCSYLPVDHPDAFSETMYLLLGGTGVGFGVQTHQVAKLPPILGITHPQGRQRKKRYLIGDSIEGWSDAVKMLVESYFYGKRELDFDFRDIRPKGAQLVTSGGKAPGPEPLREALVKIQNVFEKAIAERGKGRRLKPIEAHEIQCHIADAVLAGGIRRAAMISLFSFDDYEMRAAKVGSWWENHPERGRANNSAVIVRDKIKKKEFREFWNLIEASGSGEPGVFFTDDIDGDWGGNPCFTGDTIIATADGRNGVSIKELAEESQGKYTFPVYSASKASISNQYRKSDNFLKWKTEIKSAVAFKTGTKEVIEVILSDGSSFRCTPDHRLALPNGEYIEAQYSEGYRLEKFYTYSSKNSNKSYRHINSKTNGYSRQYRMIWEFQNDLSDDYADYTIDHIDGNSKNDSINNLQLLSKKDHDLKSNNSKRGKNNPVYKVRNVDLYKWRLRRASIRTNGERYFWPEEKILEAINVFEQNNPMPEEINEDVILDDNIFVKEIVWSEEYEDVYDLTVEDNHNFYIISNTDDDDYLNSSGVLVHNCMEISLRPFQFCNLTEINASNIESQEDLNHRAKVASIIGTLQASYTDFHYLRDIWQETTEKEALLGVSMTGIASGTVLDLNLEEAASIVKDTNTIWAEKLNIRPAARTTAVKPAGTTSLVLGSSSGIHGWWDPYYTRRIRVGKNEAIYNYLRKDHPELLEDELFRPDSIAVISVPQKAPEGSILRHESPIEMLERVKRFNLEWVAAGHRSGVNKNNVSCTVNIKDEEWEEVGEWLWNNRKTYTGVSVLPYDGGTYKQAPFETIDEKTYNKMYKKLSSIDLTKVIEETDETELAAELACGPQGCDITGSSSVESSFSFDSVTS